MSSTSLHVLSQPPSKILERFVLWKIVPVRLLIQKLYLASDEAFKNASYTSLFRHDIYSSFKYGE